MTATAPQIFRALRHTVIMINPWRPMIRDGRGRPCPLYRLDRRWRQTESNAELPREQFERLRMQLLSETTSGMGGPPAALLVIAGIQLLFCLIQLVAGSPARFLWRPALVALVFVGFAVTYRYRIPTIGREAIVRAMLVERRCPSCAYDLSATSLDSGGLTLCPECGAAWRLPREPDA